MDSAQIATLLAPFLTHPLPPHELFQISIYIDLLLRWNARINLTAIRTEEEIVTRHFGESLFAAQTLFPPGKIYNYAAQLGEKDGEEHKDFTPNEAQACPEPGQGDLLSSGAPQRSAGAITLHDKYASPAQAIGSKLEAGPPETMSRPHTLLDLGSGAGFPGLPIHLTIPNLQTTLLEAQQKKVAFLREVIRALTLTNINVSPARAEDFPHTSATVTLRAVERFDQILPTAARLVAPEGRLALLIAEPQHPRAQSALPNFVWNPPIPIPNSAARLLLIGALH